MSWQENINQIKEIFPGHFQIILDFATVKFLPHVLRDDHKFVLIFNHTLDDFEQWGLYDLPLFNSKPNYKVTARNIRFDFALPTIEFKNLLPNLKGGITLIQLNHLPNSYLDLNKIKGKNRYELLKNECEYLFEINIPSATDYGTLVSPDRGYLQSLIDNDKINWKNLP
jgi:hypothetical protein